MTLGAGWRFGPTPWNHEVDADFRDERQLILALELAIIGAVADGYGTEAFAAKQVQASGRNPSFTPAWHRRRSGALVRISPRR
jgi:hypothetical protein